MDTPQKETMQRFATAYEEEGTTSTVEEGDVQRTEAEMRAITIFSFQPIISEDETDGGNPPATIKFCILPNDHQIHLLDPGTWLTQLQYGDDCLMCGDMMFKNWSHIGAKHHLVCGQYLIEIVTNFDFKEEQLIEFLNGLSWKNQWVNIRSHPGMLVSGWFVDNVTIGLQSAEFIPEWYEFPAAQSDVTVPTPTSPAN